MALKSKPHSVTVAPAQETTDNAGRVNTPSLGASAKVACQITPLSASDAFNATGVAIKRPYLLLCDTADYNKFHTGAVATWAILGKTLSLKVMAEPEFFATGRPTDHVSVHLDLLTF